MTERNYTCCDKEESIISKYKQLSVSADNNAEGQEVLLLVSCLLASTMLMLSSTINIIIAALTSALAVMREHRKRLSSQQSTLVRLQMEHTSAEQLLCQMIFC